MKLTWYGHACFRLETDAGSVVFDPYEQGYLPGLKLPELSADTVICSHGHGDHSAAELVTLTGNEPSFRLEQIPCFHDGVRGAKRGKNLITVIEADGRRVAHLGDLGHMLSEKQLEALGSIDILMIPVGGVYTVDAKQAKRLCDEIKPRVIVPMHYRMEGRGLGNVAGVEDFLSLFDASEILYLDGSECDCGLLPAKVAVFSLC